MDRLDEFFNNKMSERQVPFDEAHWQDAQQMLDQRDRRRRGIIWWWWGSGVVFILLLGLLLFWWGRPADQSDEPERSMTIESKTTDDTAPDVTTADSDTEASVWPSTDTDQQPSKEQEPTATLNIDKSIPSSTGQKAEVQKSGIQSNRDVFKNKVGINDEIESSNKKGLKDNKAKDSMTPALAPKAANDQLPDNTRKQADPLAAIDPVEEQQFEAIKLLPLVNPAELERLRGLPKMKVESTIQAVVPRKFSSREITLAATANPGDGKSFPGAIVQLQYNFALNQQYNVYAKTGYRFLDGTFSATQESNRQAYGFGLSVERYQLTPSRLHYITGGLGIGKSWKRHRFQAGLAYQYLLGVQGTLSKSEKPEFTAIFTNPNEEGSGWMDKEGFRHHLVGGELGYQLRVFGPLSVQLNLQYWLNDLLEEGYEPTSDEVLQERGPLFIDLGISYRL